MSLRLRDSPGTIDDRTARRLDERGVVGVDGARVVRGPQRDRRGTLAVSGRRRGLARHGLDDSVTARPASPCRRPGSAGTAASTPARTAAMTAANSARDARGRAASCTTTMSASSGTNASPARTESERVAPPGATSTPSGAVHSTSAGSTDDDTRRTRRARRRPRDPSRRHRPAGRTASAHRIGCRSQPQRRSPTSSQPQRTVSGSRDR